MTDTYMKRTQYEIVRTYPAPVERVFQAWSDPEEFARWVWAGMGDEVWAEVDLCVGGAYRAYTNIAGGRHQGEGWSGMCGLYVDVVENQRLVMTMQFDADVGYNQGGALALDELMIVEFQEDDGGTRMRVQHLGIPDDGVSAPTHAQGMGMALDLLGKGLAT